MFSHPSLFDSRMKYRLMRVLGLRAEPQAGSAVWAKTVYASENVDQEHTS